MRRRDFIAALGGAAVWPLSARAQQGRFRRVGVLVLTTAAKAIGLEVPSFFQQRADEVIE